MSFRRWVARLDLIPVLLIALLVELALNRLAVPVLRPSGGALPAWHRNLDLVGLFTFHLATLLGLGVGVWKIVEMFLAESISRPARVTVAAVATIFYGLAAYSVISRSGDASLAFHLETAFLATLFLIWLSLLLLPGDLFVKIGLGLLIVPFALHYYGSFTVRFLMDSATARETLFPDHVRWLGQWAVGIVAILVPICFAPRPLHRYALRPGPMVIAGFVGTIAAVVMRRHYEVGMELASRGLGIELGFDPPFGLIVVYVLAAASTAWILAATLTADAPARRRVGMGFALICCGGYAFSWPLQFLAVIAGGLTIVEGGSRVAEEEHAELPPPRHHAPPIAQTTWRAYIDALARLIGARGVRYVPQGSIEETIIDGLRRDVPFTVTIQRTLHGIHAVDMCFGVAPAAGSEPAVTLLARAEGVLVSAHPAPPMTQAPTVRTGDAAFDRRFRVQDAAEHGRTLLDDALRARMTALLDGWVAVWPGTALHYRVCPGRGAPIDHPIPIPSLSLGVGDIESATERLVRVFDLLEEIA